MASNREERRLQRQRGAQRHQVQDVDFGSPFPTASIPKQRVTRSTVASQPEIPIQPKTQEITGPQKRSTPPPIATTNDANTSAKRKRIDAPSELRSSSPLRRERSRTTPRRDENELGEEALAGLEEPQALGLMGDNDELGGEADISRLIRTPKSRRILGQSSVIADEVTDSPRDAPGTSQRYRTELETTQVLGKRLSGVIGDVNTPVQGAGQDHRSTSRERLLNDAKGTKLFGELARRHSPRNHETSSPADEVDELSPDRPDRSRLVFQQGQFSENEEEQEAEAIDDIEAAEKLQKKRKRDSVSDAVEDETEEETQRNNKEQAGPELSPKSPARRAKTPKKRKFQGSRASPATQRQPKKPKAKSNSRRSGEVIPVIIHRLTKPVVYGEDDTDADLLNEDVPFAKRSGVNAVDVLSTFCEEVIDSGLIALEEGGANAEDVASRREYRTKLRAVEAFQEELRTRLLELTVILDADYLLNKRVRAAQKEKISLREELLRLRAEREKIALRMDEVRIKHENSSKKAQEQAALNNSLHDIELAVSIGVEKTPAGEADDTSPPDLKTLLKIVVGEVSSTSARGGILKQVKDFNAFLERAASALEGQP